MDGPHDHSVYISMPPRTEFLALLRTVTGGVATRLQLPLDAIDDLRLAVDEAVAFLLTTVPDATRVELRLDPDDTELAAAISTDSSLERWPPSGYQETLPWQVISGLTERASVSRPGQGMPTITFVKRTLVPRTT